MPLLLREGGSFIRDTRDVSDTRSLFQRSYVRPPRCLRQIAWLRIRRAFSIRASSRLKRNPGRLIELRSPTCFLGTQPGPQVRYPYDYTRTETVTCLEPPVKLPEPAGSGNTSTGRHLKQRTQRNTFSHTRRTFHAEGRPHVHYDYARSITDTTNRRRELPRSSPNIKANETTAERSAAPDSPGPALPCLTARVSDLS